MNKKNIQPVLMIAFALVAAYTACMPAGVAVYDLAQSPEPFRCTYFNLVEDVQGSISLPVAALCACINLMCAGIYLAVKKTNLLSAMKILSVAAAVLAVVPILVKDPVIQLVPNMLLPIAMLAEYVVVYYMAKKEEVPVVAPLTGNRKK